MKFNINNTVSFILTESGIEIYNKRFDNLNLPDKYRPAPRKAGEKIHMQLWEVMQVFGPHIYLGMKPCFAEMNLEFDKHSFENNYA